MNNIEERFLFFSFWLDNTVLYEITTIYLHSQQKPKPFQVVEGAWINLLRGTLLISTTTEK